MRIVVVGTSGSGKTTFARDAAARLRVPHVEMDAINWQPGWRDLARGDPVEFTRRVAQAAGPDRWVMDGNYSVVRDIVWSRATHLVWLDYARPVVMRRVIGRSLARAISGRELWAGNREEWWRMLRASHPIRWAWNTWQANREKVIANLARPDFAHLTLLHLRHPREAEGALRRLLD